MPAARNVWDPIVNAIAALAKPAPSQHTPPAPNQFEATEEQREELEGLGAIFDTDFELESRSPNRLRIYKKLD